MLFHVYFFFFYILFIYFIMSVLIVDLFWHVCLNFSELEGVGCCVES